MRIAVRQQKWAHLKTIPENQLSTFIFASDKPDSRLKVLNEHEIIVDGKLYDVVRKSDDGKRTKYLCKYDHKEEALIEKTRLFNSRAQQMPIQNTTRLIAEKIIKSGIIRHDDSLKSVILKTVYSDYHNIKYSVPELQL